MELHVQVAGKFVDDARVADRSVLDDGLFLVVGFDKVDELLPHIFGPARLFGTSNFCGGHYFHDRLLREDVITLVELARGFQTSRFLCRGSEIVHLLTGSLLLKLEHRLGILRIHWEYRAQLGGLRVFHFIPRGSCRCGRPKIFRNSL